MQTPSPAVAAEWKEGLQLLRAPPEEENQVLFPSGIISNHEKNHQTIKILLFYLFFIFRRKKNQKRYYTFPMNYESVQQDVSPLKEAQK